MDQRSPSTAPWDGPHADFFFGQATADHATRRTRERSSRAMRTGRYPSPPCIGPIVPIGYIGPVDFENTMEEDEPGPPTRRTQPPVRWDRRLGCYAPVDCASQRAGTVSGGSVSRVLSSRCKTSGCSSKRMLTRLGTTLLILQHTEPL